jgi:hypothetical protein
VELLPDNAAAAPEPIPPGVERLRGYLPEGAGPAFARR